MTSLIILDRVIQHERRFDKVCMGFNLPLTSPFAGRVLMVVGPVFFSFSSPPEVKGRTIIPVIPIEALITEVSLFLAFALN